MGHRISAGGGARPARERACRALLCGHDLRGEGRSGPRRLRRGGPPGHPAAALHRRPQRHPWPGQRDRVPGLAGPGRDLRRGPGRRLRHRGRRRGARHRRQRPARPGGRHRPGAARRPPARGDGGGPVPHRPAGRRRGPRHPGSARDLDGQALRRQQRRDPAHRLCDQQRPQPGRQHGGGGAGAAGALLPALQGGGPARRRRVGDGLLQPPQRRLRLPAPGHPGHPQGRLGLGRLRGPRLHARRARPGRGRQRRARHPRARRDRRADRRGLHLRPRPGRAAGRDRPAHPVGHLRRRPRPAPAPGRGPAAGPGQHARARRPGDQDRHRRDGPARQPRRPAAAGHRAGRLGGGDRHRPPRRAVGDGGIPVCPGVPRPAGHAPGGHRRPGRSRGPRGVRPGLLRRRRPPGGPDRGADPARWGGDGPSRGVLER